MSRVLSLDKMLRDTIHFNDGFSNIEYTRTGEVCKQGCKHSSPNNIRRLFVGRDGITIHTFCSIASTNWDKAVQSTIKRKFTGSEDMLDVYSKKQTGDIRIRSVGLKFLDIPLVVSNIEEIYFDCSYFSFAMESNQLTVGKNVNNIKSINGKTGVLLKDSNRDILGIIATAHGVGEQDLVDRFKNLRIIGVVNNLDKILSSVQKDKELRKMDCDTWLQTEVSSIKAYGSAVVCVIANEHRGVAVRSGIYEYDKVVLKGYFEKEQSRIDKLNVYDNDVEDRTSNEEDRREKLEEEDEIVKILREIEGKKQDTKAVVVGIINTFIWDMDEIDKRRMLGIINDKHRNMYKEVMGNA